MTVDLDTLLDSGKKVYVKNTSRPMGHIVLTFVTPNGKAVPRPIPRTWIPICLTDTLAPNIIRESNDLRQFIAKGVLALIDPSEAQKVLVTSEGREEAQRLNLSDFSNKAEATDRVLQMENQYTSEANINNPMGPVEGQQVDPVNNRVKATLLQVEANDITEREAVSEFRIMQGELSSHDLTYIISQAESEGPLKRFAFQILAEQNAVVDPNIVDNEPAEDPAQVEAARAAQKVE
jgi:hypothetical protein